MVNIFKLIFLTLASNSLAQRLPYDGSPLYPDHRQQAQHPAIHRTLLAVVEDVATHRCLDIFARQVFNTFQKYRADQ
ncbi:hypothetical protein BDV24DRAFT_170489 [Aspergillus arachidicola]|uniref:Secreted protein n=1 Tax=Aspergillus arachidicola TaxID=656916 RepID=A0A5N6XMQ9_9EURO|nr:hypothetical protein BDV24DRAFT_170489 [Aspergillus arachidicola]